MIKKFFLLLAAAVIVLVAILLFNTLRFFSPSITKAAPAPLVATDSAGLHLSQAIQIKTVSFGDTLPIDTVEFTRFRHFMEQTYPLMHQKMERKVFNEFSYVFIWKGKDTTLAPNVLMAHLDVVPVEPVAEKMWTYPSFSGTITADTVWGRGAVDDKGSAIAIMEAAEMLVREGFQPARTIYFCFGHDEEISGRRGANIIAQWFQENKIKPALVLDEGGMVDTKRFNRPVALIGTGEKGYTNIDLSVEVPGGHSSMPAKETAIDILNKAIVKIREKPMPGRIPPAVSELLTRTAGNQGFTTRMALANMWLFKGAVMSQLEETKETNAMVHTTLVPTIVKSGIKDNVIPTVAKATFNSRILPGDKSDDVLAFVKAAVNDERVKVTKQTLSLFEPSGITAADHPAFQKIEQLTYRTVPDALVTPYLLIGATDSRYFRSFSDAVLNFSPMQDIKGFHGIDERIGISDLKRMINFYRLLLMQE